MASCYGVDFGTSNTLIARWDEVTDEAEVIKIDGFSKPMRLQEETVWVIPSLINYSEQGDIWVGRQVLDKNLDCSNTTFKWMKRYVATKNPATLPIGGGTKSFIDAAADLLKAVLFYSTPENKFSDDDIVTFSVPVDAFEHYQAWLPEIGDALGIRRTRIIDEPSAAALGYKTELQSGDVYMVFDFGGGTLDCSVVRIVDEPNQPSRVLGKASEDIGGITIDQWIYRKILEKNRLNEWDERVKRLGRLLLLECERAKERLSFEKTASISAMDPETGTIISAQLSRDEFENMLEERGFSATINRAMRRALQRAAQKGYTEDDVVVVLMTGGSSLIPIVQAEVCKFFGKEKVRLHRPFDSVVIGAATYATGINLIDYIEHEYALRYLDMKTGKECFYTLIKAGTTYPTREPIATIPIKATLDGQKMLGILIYEVSKRPADKKSIIEVIHDRSGRVIVVEKEEDTAQVSYICINKKAPTFINADPPARVGEERFRASFGIDANRRLTITVEDLYLKKTLMKDYPVIKLT